MRNDCTLATVTVSRGSAQARLELCFLCFTPHRVSGGVKTVLKLIGYYLIAINYFNCKLNEMFQEIQEIIIRRKHLIASYLSIILTFLPLILLLY